jgi:hypothetical protein
VFLHGGVCAREEGAVFVSLAKHVLPDR